MATHARPAAAHHADAPATLASRVIIDRVRPVIDGGRFPAKRSVGESLDLRADIFADGHDVIVAVARHRHVAPDRSTAGDWVESPMWLVPKGTDEWFAWIALERVGWLEFSVSAWIDRFETWRRELQLKATAGQDVAQELIEGVLLLSEAASRAEQSGPVNDTKQLKARADVMRASGNVESSLRTAFDDELRRLMATHADRSHATDSQTYRVWIDRARGRFGSWYELFPRSAGPDATRSGTFREAEALLPGIAALGFDVIYLPPIHPIGTSFRKGPNNSLVAKPGDPGSPWAIGSDAGGHTAVEPGLGTLDDFAHFRGAAERHRLEVALDLAFQCSPDHPWVREHPEWFRHRPDGSIKYAENPPKKYQDIYPLDFGCQQWPALWQALFDVVQFWTARGVRIFRVDNPHTKTFGFWEWLIDRVQQEEPEVIFLAEAFTAPKRMRYLAKAGFTQSYSYFTWRNTKDELTEYFTELTTSESKEYLRPNLFTNTPDILHAYLQQGGPPAFEARVLLAATLGASYGIYSGFELCEGRAVPGTEEYLDSEKYQYRKWDHSRPGIQSLVARINQARRSTPALQFDHTLRFHETDNPQIIAFSKHEPAPPGSRIPSPCVFVVVSLDPHRMQHGFVRLPFDLHREQPPDDVSEPAAAVDPNQELFVVQDLLDDISYTWRGEWNYVRFDPGVKQGHVFTVGGLE